MTAAAARSLDGAEAEAAAFEIGRDALGPFLVAFCRWLRGATPPDAALLFLARDGALIRRVWLELYPKTSGAAAYFLISRAAATLAGLDGLEAVDGLSRDAPASWTVARVLARRLRLPDEEIAALCGPEAWRARARGRAGRAMLRHAAPTLLARAEAHRRGLMSAFVDAGGARAAPVVVDIGYRGAAQTALAALAGRPVAGRYILTHAAARRTARKAGPIESFAGSYLHPGDFRCAINRCRFVLEAALSDDRGSFQRWDETGAARFLRADEPDVSRRIRRALHRGAVACAGEAAAEGAPGAAAPLRAFLERPEPRLAAALADLVFESGNEKRAMPLLCAAPDARRGAYALWAEGQAALDRHTAAAPIDPAGLGVALLRRMPESVMRRAAPIADRLRIATNAPLYLRETRRPELIGFRLLERLSRHRAGIDVRSRRR